MRVVSGVFLVLLAAVPAWGAAECPGITTENGETGVHLIGTDVTCTGGSCPSGVGSFVEDVIVQLCNLGVVPAACGKCECCKEPATDLVAGTDLDFVGPNPSNYCGLGGRGKPIGEAALCLLRDLANPARAPSSGDPGIHLSNGFSIGIGNVSVDQRVGFVKFELAARRMRGYHSVSFCLPVLGCVNNQTQRFTATLMHVPDGPAPCSSYEFENPWLLRLDSDDTEHNATIEVGPFPVYTPVGPVNVTPRLDYEANLEAVASDWAAGNAATARTQGCASASLVDVADSSGVLFASTLAGQSPIALSGWDSILGLGGRDPDTGSAVWSPPAGDFPPRPDFDFSIARATDEKRPVNRFHAGVDVTYGLDALGIKLSFPPFSLDAAEVFVTSELDAAFSSQFQLAFEEERYKVIPPDCKPNAFTAVELQSALSAFAELLVKAGIRIEFSIDLGFYTKHFRIRKEVPVINPTTPGPVPMLGPLAKAQLLVGTPPPIGSEAYDQFVSFSADSENGVAFVTECLTEPPPPDQPPPPPPQFTPGDPRDLLEPLRFPCNICLFLPNSIFSACVPKAGVPADYDCGFGVNGGPCPDPNCENVPISPPVSVNLTEVLFPISQASLPADQQWLCNQTEKSGCFDLCQYDPNASQPLVIVESAVTKFGTVCRDGVPGGSGGTKEGVSCGSDADCDDGNPCTTDDCVFGGEFGTCHLTANQAACDDGTFCNGADTCALGICSGHAGSPCAASGNCCDEASDTCPDTCPTTPCDGKNENDPCDDATSCTSGDRCVSTIAGLLCRGDPAVTCEPGSVCTANLCEEVDEEPMCVEQPSGACPPDCGDGDLDPGEECDGQADAACPGKCQPDCSCAPPPERTGNPCTDPSQCASGFCVDGVCCDTACDAPMEQCNLGGQEGSCATVAAPAPVASRAGLLIVVGVLAAVAALSFTRLRG